MTEYISLPGYINNPAFYSEKIIAYINSSRSEGFGKIIIEAMNTENIVIASDCPGPVEIIHHGNNGFLFKKENIASLVKLMNKVINLSDKNIGQIRMNALHTALKYTPDKIAAQFNAKLEQDYLLEKNISDS